MRILVIRFSSLGDVVLATAPVRALHALHQDAEILFATKREYSPLLDNYPSWLQVIPLESGESIADYRKRLGSSEFDLIVDLHGSLRSRHLILGLKSKAIRRVDKSTLRRFRMVWSKKGLDNPISTVASYLAAVDATERSLPSIILNESERARAVDTVPQRIGIGWGAKHATKAVPDVIWRDLISRIATTKSIRVAVFGVSADRDEIERFASEMASEVSPSSFEAIIGQPLRETITDIASCSAFLSSDSGLMHVADALGVPTFGFFGPTHPSLGFAPAGPHSKSFHAGTWCSPCHRHGSAPCFRERRFCFDELNLETAASAVMTSLEVKESASHT